MAKLKHNTITRDPATGEAFVALAGTEAPEWLGGKPQPVEAPEEPSEDVSEPVEDYSQLTVAQLQDEIAARNLIRSEEELINDKGNKPDLVAALTADDEG